jgi:hypothetical protein
MDGVLALESVLEFARDLKESSLGAAAPSADLVERSQVTLDQLLVACARSQGARPVPRGRGGLPDSCGGSDESRGQHQAEEGGEMTP